MRKALITGSLGQDGQYLSEHLLELGYKVYGLTRRNPPFTRVHVEYIYGDLRNEESLYVAIRKVWPDEIYNLGGQVYVPVSWDAPAETLDVNAGGPARIMKIVERIKSDTRIYQASSSEMFGNHMGVCDESTLLRPMSPYGVSKVAAHRLVELYRDRGLYCVSGMLFNHESPRRGHEMVTRKIARHVAGWANGDTAQLMLGNLDSRRDWGFAGDYVKAMHLMLQQPESGNYVIGTGVSHSVKEFLLAACEFVGISEEKALAHVTEDPRFKRTQEIFDLRADTRKAQAVLSWKPTIDFKALVELMVTSESRRLVELKYPGKPIYRDEPDRVVSSKVQREIS